MTWQMWAGIHERFDGPPWECVSSHPRTVQAHGYPYPMKVTVTEDPEGPYYGWLYVGESSHYNNDDGSPTMIQFHKGAFTMQFAYGPQAEVDAGRGRILRLHVEAD